MDSCFARKLRTLTLRGEATVVDGCALALAADGRVDAGNEGVVPSVTDGRMDDGRVRVDDGQVRVDDRRVAREDDEDFFLEAYGSVNLDRRGREFFITSSMIC